MVAGAKKEATSVRSSGHAEAERELATIRAEVDRLSRRRDGIIAQLGALKDVVAGFGQDEATEDVTADEGTSADEEK